MEAETMTIFKAWDHELRLGDVFHNEEMTFEDRRDAIVARIRKARWYDEDDIALWEAVDGLANAEDTDEFDAWWDAFYDWCDAGKRVWVETFG
jgi:hypothetical protein